ncbi:hypothetical protein V8951_00210 (plasmid) [Raoultella ornithinolytica]|uniref:hypothetical protein n=1 Tax=Raoultella ornithinolytica TaxID=54291 RepID=UPI0030CD3A7A
MMYANVNANDSAKPKRYKPETGGILPQMADVVEWIATADNRATWTFETSTRKGEGVFSESRKKACRLSPTRFMVIAHQQNLVSGLVPGND